MKLFSENPINYTQVEIILKTGIILDLNEHLISAVNKRDLKLAELLLLYGADPNARMPLDTRSILALVINPWYSLVRKQPIDDEKDQAMLDLLLKYKADPNLVGTMNGTAEPLMTNAIKWNRVEMVKSLVNAGESVNPSPKDLSQVPLYQAIFPSFPSEAIEYNLDVNKYYFRHTEILELLLEQGADPTIASLGGTSLISWVNMDGVIGSRTRTIRWRQEKNKGQEAASDAGVGALTGCLRAGCCSPHWVFRSTACKQELRESSCRYPRASHRGAFGSGGC